MEADIANKPVGDYVILCRKAWTAYVSLTLWTLLLLALVLIADTVKPDARAAVAALHALGIKVVMLTGDDKHAAAAIRARMRWRLRRSVFLDLRAISSAESLASDTDVVVYRRIRLDD